MKKPIVLIAVLATATSLAFNTVNAGNDREEYNGRGKNDHGKYDDRDKD